MDLTRKVEALERRLGRLEDIESIKQLRWDYSRACDDNHNSFRLVPMFVPDAEIVFHPPFSGVVRGHDALKDMFDHNAERNGITWTLHYYLQPLITVHEDQLTADATWYLWELAKMPNHKGEEEPVWVAGEYFDSYVKDEGRWKFKRIEIKLRLLSPYQDGWVKNMIRKVHPK
ncbi:MAG: nuclear transport factor 2 family protein [Candidatus Binataceae bacterium]|nr:nuclear transport factor 2 family protein [Candidatus Binataceae bacterium]